jgi:hypothetical protein
MFIFGHGGLTLLAMRIFPVLPKRPRLRDQRRDTLTVLLFALLPDLLDKPLTLWLVPHAPSTRWIGHTLTFWIILWCALRACRPCLAWFVGASLWHLCLDRMWQSPHTLLFPLLGWHMDPGSNPELSLWEFLRGTLHQYTSSGGLLLPELVGIAMLVHAALGMIPLIQKKGSPVRAGP